MRVLVGGRKRATPFLDIRVAGARRAASRACCRSPSRPTTRAPGRFYVYFTDNSGRPARRRVQARVAPSAPPPARRGSCCGCPTPRATTTAACCCSGPTSTSTSARATAAAAATSTARAATPRTSARLLGKILRIDPAASGGRPYTVPGDNPFVARDGARGEIYSYGLRNPWRFSFDRRTGDLSIGDVGQNEVEEIDFVRRGRGRGANFGWRPFEGRSRFAPGESAPGHVPPVITRSHGQGWCSITGGVVVRDPALAGLRGRYVFGDFCEGRILSARLAPGRATLGARDLAARPEPVLVRRGRARPRVRDLAERARSTGSCRDERRGARRPRRRAGCAPTTRARTRCRARTRGSSAATRRGWSTRARTSPTTSTRWPPRSRRAAAPAGSRSRTITATTSRACSRCASGSAARPWPRARYAADVRLADGERFGPLAVARRARPRARPPRVRGGRRVLHRRRRARRGQRVRRRGPRRATWTRCERLRELPLRVICPGHGPPVWDPRAKLDEYLAHRRERERRLLAALDDGLRGEDELLDAVWDDAPDALRPAAAVTLGAHREKLRAEGRWPQPGGGRPAP